MENRSFPGLTHFFILFNKFVFIILLISLSVLSPGPCLALHRKYRDCAPSISPTFPSTFPDVFSFFSLTYHFSLFGDVLYPAPPFTPPDIPNLLSRDFCGPTIFRRKCAVTLGPFLMDSLWLCVDAEPAKPLRSGKAALVRSQSSGVQAPVLGIFTDHPANIARRLPRPTTPFVPATEFALPRKQAAWDQAPGPEPMCDSPPADLGFEFGSPSYEAVSVALSLF
jgi:hypothetical protein